MLPEIPILRLGQVYDSLDLQEVTAVATGKPVAKVSFANDGLVKSDLKRMNEARDVLRSIPVADLLEITIGDIFTVEPYYGVLPFSDIYPPPWITEVIRTGNEVFVAWSDYRSTYPDILVDHGFH